jgi:DNA polymerase III subunit gamma/tau
MYCELMSRLDLKYRPSNFSQVIGNGGVIKLILTRSKNGTLGDQSMMLSGPKGCGKTTLARIIAKALSCTNLQDGEPCNECPSCLSIMDETSQSFEELDAASQGTVEKIRGMIRDADYETLNGSKQVYIIDEAQRLSAASQEALLKAIESRTFIVILCTTDPHKVKLPIRSRLEEYPIHSPPVIELLARLILICNEEQIEFEESGLKLLAKVKDNCPRECIIALSTMSQVGVISESAVQEYFRFDSFKLVAKLLETIDHSPSQAFECLDELVNRESPTWIKEQIMLAIASSIRINIGAKPTFPVPTDFFQSRGRAWAKVAADLSGIDRINMSEITAVLLQESPAVPVIAHAPNFAPLIDFDPKPGAILKVHSKEPSAPEKIAVKEEPKKVEPKPAPAPPPVESQQLKKSPKRREVTVEGVRYSSDESLTSLDDKVQKTKDVPPESSVALLQVQLSAEHAPINEKDFKETLLARFKG